jgi:hypothetical protein
MWIIVQIYSYCLGVFDREIEDTIMTLHVYERSVAESPLLVSPEHPT